MPGTKIGQQETINRFNQIENAVDKGVPGSYFRNPVSRFNAVTGAANTGAQITFQIAAFLGVQAIQLLRNVSRDPGSAMLLQTYPTQPDSAGDALVSRLVTYHDADKSTFGKTVYYFLKVLPRGTNFQPLLSGPLRVAVP